MMLTFKVRVSVKAPKTSYEATAALLREASAHRLSKEHSTAIKGNDNLTTTCLDLKLLLQNFKVLQECSHTSLSRELISTFNLSKEKIRVYFWEVQSAQKLFFMLSERICFCTP